MRRFGWLVAVSLLVVAMAGVAAADDVTGKKVCGLCNAADADTYGKHAMGTLGRGLGNGLLCWTELIAQPVHSGKSGENVLVGVGKGVGYTIKRFLVGVGEILTFWTPPGSMQLANDCSLGVMGMVDR